MNDDPLALFSTPVRAWFAETFDAPTAPQAAGWPAIQRGEHTLILAPTGSGKTLAAFLWGINEIGCELSDAALPDPGVRLLYISPLKALNNDIERNLRAPLSGIQKTAADLGLPWPRVRVAVRTGDTPASARAGMVKSPPHILITTPESLYLILTSPRAREMLRTVRSVIVDEIHTLVGDKRGSHLALSLERLEHLTGAPIQRIGLSATIRPLEEAARFLGGQQWRAHPASETVEPLLEARSVTVVDTGYRKPMALEVVTPVDDFRSLPADSIWPLVIPQVLRDVMLHRTTLIFCNNRRLAERTADRLNAQIAAERSEEMPPGSTAALAPGGRMRDKGMFAIGAEGPIRAHHGSMSREARRAMEEDLKAGRLPALVGTSSLELGIDIGSVDLVVQLQSPKSVSQGLQRVGRSGHLVGQTSRGRIYATFREDLLEAAAVARGMLEGDVEPTHAPLGPLDVLAQQILAMVAVEPWDAPALFALARQAYPYRDLSPADFRSVLEMISGRYAAISGATHPSLQAKIAWDRANDRLYPLPGTRWLALGNAGTITDRGAYDVVLADRTTRVGALDEEFIFESRTGDAFILGSNVWRILEIEDDRIVVGDAAGATPRMPFWRGDYPWRPYELGARIARLRREIGERLERSQGAEEQGSGGAEEIHKRRELEQWLRREYALDERSARNLLDYLDHQLEIAGEIAADDAIVIESFTDAVGEERVVVHSPFGGRVNGAWALALGDALEDRLGFRVETQVNDDGILFRLPAGIGAEPIVEALRAMSPTEARERVERALPDSALFGARFRMNASRALLLPRARGRKRTPFWLQRLKARDLLALVRRFDDFPLIRETYRECLEDALDLPHLESLLAGVQSGSVRVSAVETATPSPVAAGLLFNFISTYMYEWDAPKAERQMLELAWQAEIPETTQAQGLIALLRPEAVAEVVERIGRTGPGRGARSVDELAVIMEAMGDLSEAEILARCAPAETDAQQTNEIGRGWLAALLAAGRIQAIHTLAGEGLERRYISTEHAEEYANAFRKDAPDHTQNAATNILRRYLMHAGPITRRQILARYSFDPDWLDTALSELIAQKEILPYTTGEDAAYLDRRISEQARRRTIAILRREVQPVSPAAYANFLAAWQHVAGPRLPTGAEGVRLALAPLHGFALPVPLWEREILPARLSGFTPADLAACCAPGGLVWAVTGSDARHARVRFFPRGEGRALLPPADLTGLSETAQVVYAYLKEEGASPAGDIESVLRLALEVVRAALVDLALAGLATADSIAALWAVLGSPSPEATERAPLSALEEELARRRVQPAYIGRRPDRERHRVARRRVGARLAQETEAQANPWGGHWSLLHRPGILGPARDDETLVALRVRTLLARYGVVTREVVDREEALFDWGALSAHLSQLELRGEVHRGYFVRGLRGVQYALSEAVEQLRAAAEPQKDAPFVVLNAVDPAQLYGTNLPAEGDVSEAADTENPASDIPRFARLPSTHVITRAGRIMLLAEDGGDRMWAPNEAPVDQVQDAVRAYLARPGAVRRVAVASWNGEPALRSPAQEILRPLGFSRTPNGLEWRKPL